MKQQTVSTEEYAALVRAQWSEREFQRQVMAKAKECGWRGIHFCPARAPSGRWITCQTGDPGFPDTLLLRGGQLVVWELKTGKGTTTAAQKAWLAEFALTGAITGVVWPRDWDTIVEVLTGGTR